MWTANGFLITGQPWMWCYWAGMRSLPSSWFWAEASSPSPQPGLEATRRACLYLDAQPGRVLPLEQTRETCLYYIQFCDLETVNTYSEINRRKYFKVDITMGKKGNVDPPNIKKIICTFFAITIVFIWWYITKGQVLLQVQIWFILVFLLLFWATTAIFMFYTFHLHFSTALFTFDAYKKSFFLVDSTQRVQDDTNMQCHFNKKHRCSVNGEKRQVYKGVGMHWNFRPRKLSGENLIFSF